MLSRIDHYSNVMRNLMFVFLAAKSPFAQSSSLSSYERKRVHSRNEGFLQAVITSPPCPALARLHVDLTSYTSLASNRERVARIRDEV